MEVKDGLRIYLQAIDTLAPGEMIENEWLSWHEIVRNYHPDTRTRGIFRFSFMWCESLEGRIAQMMSDGPRKAT